MIKKLDISGIHFEVSKELQRYIVKKVKRVERYIPKKSRQSVRVEVKLREEKSKDKKQCHCEIIMHLPGENITAAESTLNMFAACDIVLAKIKSQLEKYRAVHDRHDKVLTKRRIRKLFGKIRSRR